MVENKGKIAYEGFQYGWILGDGGQCLENGALRVKRQANISCIYCEEEAA